MEKLLERTLQGQMAEFQAQVAAQAAAQNAKIDRLAALMEQQLALVPRDSAPFAEKADMCIGHANQVNTGPVTNVQNIIQITPWDGDRRITIDVSQVAAAFSENARLREYARLGDHELVDPELAPPYVTELLMDLVKRGHADPAARNIYLSPRRADQVLVHMKSGRWEVIPLLEASRLLFDGVARGIHQIARTYAELRQLPLEAQNALTMAGMMYEDEPEEYARRAKVPMSAHLMNTAPGTA